MDSFEFNKIAGAVLGTALFVMALSIISEMIFAPEKPKQPGYVVAVAEKPEHAAAPAGPEVPAAAAEPTIAVRLASADAAAGETVGRKCIACHSLLKDQPAKVGPNLWNIVGAPAAHAATFKYSEAMLAEKAKGFTWTYENLNAFLESPRMDIPGTAMGFAGLPEPKDRANLIAYLRTLSDDPVALPAAAPGVTPNPNAPPRSTPLPAPAPH